MKRGAALVTCLVATIALAGCGGGDKKEPGTSGDPVTLSYGIWDKNQLPAMEKIAEEFHKKNPNITVKVQVTPEKYWTVLQTAAQGGQAPDVFWMSGPYIQMYASNNQLLPLDETISAEKVDLGKYPSSLVKLYNYGGKQYGVPKDFDTVAVFYNKTLFDEAKVPYPTENWTWEEYQAIAKKLTNPDKGIYGSLAPVNNQAGFYNTIPMAGGEIISADGKKSGYGSPEAIKGIEFWTQQIKDKSAPSVKFLTDNNPNQVFKTGKAAMFWTGSWAAVEFHTDPALKGKYDVAPLPKGPKGSISVIHGLGNVAYAKSKHPEEAKKFVAFLGSKEVAETQAQTGTVIPAYEGTQETWVKSIPEMKLQVFMDAVKTAIPYPASKATAVWNTLETDILTKVFSGETDAAAGLKELSTKMDEALAKEK